MLACIICYRLLCLPRLQLDSIFVWLAFLMKLLHSEQCWLRVVCNACSGQLYMNDYAMKLTESYWTWIIFYALISATLYHSWPPREASQLPPAELNREAAWLLQWVLPLSLNQKKLWELHCTWVSHQQSNCCKRSFLCIYIACWGCDRGAVPFHKYCISPVPLNWVVFFIYQVSCMFA